MNRDTVIELAKQSLMNGSISDYLTRNNIRIEYPNPSESYCNLIKEHLEDINLETIDLDYRLIPGLNNFKESRLMQEIFNNLDGDVLEIIKTIDYKENRNRLYDMKKFFKSVERGTIEPPLILCQMGRLIIIDGRTRLLIAYFLKIPIKVHLLVDIID